MTKDEALAFDLALEALELSSVTVDSFGVQRKTQEAITAIKKVRALDKMAENARELGLDYEPDEWLTGCPECGMDSGCDCDSGTWNPPAAPVQEPVAFFDPQGKGFYWAKPTKITAPVTADVEPLPLYTTPPAAQRQWVGLTDEEITALKRNGERYISSQDFARAIEAKLKEKNNG